MADHGDRPLFQPSFKGEKSIKGVKLLFLMARSNSFILQDLIYTILMGLVIV